MTSDDDNAPRAWRMSVAGGAFSPTRKGLILSAQSASGSEPLQQQPLLTPDFFDFLSSGLGHFEKGCQIHSEDRHLYSWPRIWLKGVLCANKYT